MTLEQLEAFIAIAREGSVRAAAKVLNKTQPTVSAGIKKLEGELNVQLFNRDSYRVALTEEGEALYTRALMISDQVEQFKIISKGMQIGIEPKISMAIDSLCPLGFLLKIIEKFNKEFEQTKLEIDFEVLGGAEEKLLNKESDIVITPFLEDYSNIDIQKICDIKLLPVGMTCLVKQSETDCQTFVRIPQIVVKNSAKESKSQIGYGINECSRQWLISDHMIKKELILNGFGWGYLEASSVINEVNDGKLSVINSVNIKPKSIPLYLCRSNKHALGPVATELWEFITQQCENFSCDYRSATTD